MIARLLENSPVKAQEAAARNSLVGAVLGGSQIEDVIVAGMNQWLAAIEERCAGGLEETPVSSNFPQDLKESRVSDQFRNCPEGTGSSEERRAPRLTAREASNTSPRPSRCRATTGCWTLSIPGFTVRRPGRCRRPPRNKASGPALSRAGPSSYKFTI